MFVPFNLCVKTPLPRVWGKVEYLRGGHIMRLKPSRMAFVPLPKSPQSVPAPLDNKGIGRRYTCEPGSASHQVPKL